MNVRADTESNRAARSSRNALALLDKCYKKYCLGNDAADETGAILNAAKRGKLRRAIAKAGTPPKPKKRINAVDEVSYRLAASDLFAKRRQVEAAMENGQSHEYVARLRNECSIGSVAISHELDAGSFKDWLMRNQEKLEGYVPAPATATDVAFEEWKKRMARLEKACVTRADRSVIMELRKAASFTQIAKEFGVEAGKIQKSFPKRNAPTQS